MAIAYFKFKHTSFSLKKHTKKIIMLNSQKQHKKRPQTMHACNQVTHKCHASGDEHKATPPQLKGEAYLALRAIRLSDSP